MSDRFVKMWAEENHNYYDYHPALLNYGARAKKLFGFGIDQAFLFGREDGQIQTEFYLSENQLKKSAEDGYDFYIKKGGLEKLSIQAFRAMESIEKEAIPHLLALKLQELSAEDLLKEFQAYGQAIVNIMIPYSITQPHVIAKLEEELIRELEKQIAKEELFEVQQTLTHPKYKLIFSEEGALFRRSFAELLRGDDIDRSLLEEGIYQEEELDQAERNKVIEKFGISEKADRLADTLRDVAHLRLKMRFSWMPVLYYNELFIYEFARRYSIPRSDLRKYDIVEQELLLETGKKVSVEELAARSVGFLVRLEAGEISAHQGDKAVKQLSALTKKEKGEGIEEIEGQTASKGRAQGVVLVLSYAKSLEHSDKMAQMEEGQIVVSEMTRPNIVPALKKAGAIVTDEGGITSHAAIVARELGKPCVIGTKIATQVLKDGDEVEVDADKGVVRILNKNEN